MSLGTENVPAPLSAADVAAVTGNNGNCGGGWGMGGDWLIALIILFLFPMMFGGGMWGGGMFGGMGGWGNGGMIAAANGALTRADLCSEFNFNGLENSVRGVQQGLCDGFYAMNTSMLQGFNSIGNAICNSEYQNAQLINGVNSNVMQGFNAANIVALQNQNALSTQLSDCCCKNQTGQMQIVNAIDSNACQTGRAIERGFCDTNYAQATNTTAIIQNAHNDTDRVLAKLDAMEMSRKDEVIADLRTQLAQCGDRATADSVVARLTNVINPPAVPAYPAASPCGLGNWAPQVLANGWGGNCGCNNGCGC